MTKRPKKQEKQREYVDKDHHVMSAYYDLCEKYNSRNASYIKGHLKQLIKEDPDFLDTYSFLCEILHCNNEYKAAEKFMNEAYRRALGLITDKKGNWPDVLEWGWLENRHIIRAILNKAVFSWNSKEINDALDLFRKLLKTNPGDNAGVRYYILAIQLNMSFKEFEKRFNKGGFYDTELPDWFDNNYKKFPDEFDWWDKAMEEYE